MASISPEVRKKLIVYCSRIGEHYGKLGTPHIGDMDRNIEITTEAIGLLGRAYDLFANDIDSVEIFTKANIRELVLILVETIIEYDRISNQDDRISKEALVDLREYPKKLVNLTLMHTGLRNDPEIFILLDKYIDEVRMKKKWWQILFP